MRSLILIILAGYAARCDDASYYVIEMPEETQRQYSKPFRVYWNVPTMQCKSKKIPFENLYEKYGILQNSGDSFRGEKVSILYDPGLFPALLKNETSGKFKFRNGGVPQEGDLDKHLLAFRSTLEQSIPDENFSGIGIIDFESWRPVFRQNFGVLIPYKDISYQIERRLHWFWSEKAIQARARQRFEESARAFMQTTLSVAKQMRPRALWGYYGFPYCFNMASNNMVEACADKVPGENNKIFWLWSESTALYPSIYSSKTLTTPQLAAMVRGRTAEALRVRSRGTPVLPYFWFRYREGGYLSQTDLNIVLETLYKSDASGLIIWGSSNDVNTADKCNDLLKYTTEVLGPAIARYTKSFSIRNATDDSGTTQNPVSNSGLTTWRPVLKDHLHNNNNSNKPVFLDPEYHWEPPENYTQDIAHYVEQEFKKKPEYNVNSIGNQTVLANPKKSLLIEMILSLFGRGNEDVTSDDDKTAQRVDASTTAPNIRFGFDQTTAAPNIVTKNPLQALQSAESSSEGKSNTDSFLTSTFKLNIYVSPTTSSYYTSGLDTSTIANTEDKQNHESNPSEISTVETNGTNNEGEEELAELLSVRSTEPTEERHTSYIEQLADLLALGENVTSSILSPENTTNEPKIHEETTNDEGLTSDTFQNTLDIDKNAKKEEGNDEFTMHTINFVEYLAETFSSTENTTSTNQEFTNVPLLDKFNDIINKYDEIFHHEFNDSTVNIIENSTTESPNATLAFILGIRNDNHLANYNEDNSKSTPSNVYDTETTTKTFDNIEALSSTESSSTTLPGFSIDDDSTTTENVEVLEIIRTHNEQTETTEINRTTTESEIEASVSSENVPDSNVVSTENTSEGTSTTNQDPQVVVFL